MKLAIKVILATTLGMLAVLIGFGYLRTKQRVALLEADMRRDHRVFGSTLGLCVSRSWPSAKLDRAAQLAQVADAERPQFRIAWAQSSGPYSGRPPLLPTPSAQRPGGVTHALVPDPQDAEQSLLVTRIPVDDGAELLGEIEIAESFAQRDADIQLAVANTALATGAMIAFAALNSVVFGIWLVGKPLNQLIRKARRVGEGDLSTPLELDQRDEIGELAGEMNAMCERLAQANARVAAETTARIQTLEQLRHGDRLITVGKLAAGVAHELGTPLNVVGGRARMLRSGNLAPEVVSEYLSAISEQTERMAVIIRQLLDFARRRQPNKVPHDLSASVEATARLTEAMAKRSGVTIEVSSPGPVPVRVDPVQIEQVLSNLIVNAIDACDQGGKVSVTVGLDPGEGGAAGAFVRVADNGSGIDEQARTRVFEPFFTTKDIGQGTGLGLSVAHGIVQEHGGSIDLWTSPGKGSVFTVRLPEGK